MYEAFRPHSERSLVEDTMSSTNAPKDPVVEPLSEGRPTESVLDSVRATREAATLLASRAKDSATTTASAARQQLARHPYGALGAAAAVGFVVAGGLTSPMMWAFLRFGARFAFAVAARRIGTALLEGAAEGDRAAAQRSNPSTPPRRSPVGT
jgi:ElaB/YqjD/DUF883 family membrane-anchored ribosome-binding protein